jgi:3-dehydroquinate dehydratase
MNNEMYEQIKEAAFNEELEKIAGYGSILQKSFKHLGKAIKGGIGMAKEKANPSLMRRISPFKSRNERMFRKNIRKSKAALGTVGGVGLGGYAMSGD